MKKSFLALVILASYLAGCASDPKKLDSQAAGGIPYYGNWCGPGHPRDDRKYDPPSIDETDSACKAHDYCYAEKGYLDCSCDEVFIKELWRISSKKSKGFNITGGDAQEKLARYYFSSSPCKGNIASKLDSVIVEGFGLVADWVPYFACKVMTLPLYIYTIPLALGQKIINGRADVPLSYCE